jgi:hypothetical protein
MSFLEKVCPDRIQAQLVPYVMRNDDGGGGGEVSGKSAKLAIFFISRSVEIYPQFPLF